MPRSTANKVYRTFSGGLITEASALTYPENSSLDEDNTIVFRKGNRTRRLGIDYETGYVMSSRTSTLSELDGNNHALKAFTWFSVGENPFLNFLVQQIGNRVVFYDIGPDATSSDEKSFSINLTDYRAPSKTIVYDEDVEFTSGEGFLFIVGRKINPLLVSYDEDTDTITVEELTIRIRDFEGLDDGLANDEEPSSLSKEHEYNLKNQGWIDPDNSGSSTSQVRYYTEYGEYIEYTPSPSTIITQYRNKIGRYPGNNKQWWVAKLDADDDDKGLKAGDFDPEILEKEYFGNTLAPRGHYIVNAFNKDRSAVSGVSNLDSDITADRPESVEFFAGRVWYAQGSDVYFSQVLIHKKNAGKCYQDADPTSESIPDLIASDGGHIPFPSARRITKLLSYGNGILVFAENGVWHITGGSSGFSATEYSIEKVSDSGVESRMSIVEADNKIFWWSQTGIQAIEQSSGVFGPISGSFNTDNITRETIQTYFNDTIPSNSKIYAKGYFDSASNIIQWLWASADSPANYLYDRVLNYDITLGAFYPWSISKDTVNDGPYICAAFPTPQVNQIDGTEIVTTNDGTTVVDSGGTDVTTTAPNITVRNTSLKYIAVVPQNLTDYKYTHALFDSLTFSDWATYDGTGFAYESYLETGYELFDDTMRDKQLEYVMTYFRRTEKNFELDGDDYDVDFPSSCMFRTKWNWADSAASNRWSREVQAYRHRRVPFVDPADLGFDTGFPVVVSKHKVRGKGTAIQMRFSSNEVGKNFDLLGWAVSVSGNTLV